VIRKKLFLTEISFLFFKSVRIKRINKTLNEILMNFALLFIRGDNYLFFLLLLVIVMKKIYRIPIFIKI
jgi:hypothetical protein